MDWGILSNSIGPRVRLLRNALYARSMEVSEPFGLPTGSLTVIALISANPGSSQSELAHWAGITGPSLVGIIDDLEKRGIVTRERSSKDRRRNMLVLTAEGEQTMHNLFAEVTQIEKPLREELGKKDMALLVSLLERATAAVAREED